LALKAELHLVNSKLIDQLDAKLNNFTYLKEVERYDDIQDLLTAKFREIMKESKNKLLEEYKQIKMKIRKRIFRAVAEIDAEINDKIDILVKTKNLGFEQFRNNALKTIRNLEEVIQRSQNQKTDQSANYIKLTGMFENFDELDRGYNRFKDYFEFFRNFQVELKYNEQELLDCFKITLKDNGGLLKKNLEEQSEIFAETISNLSHKDDLLSRLDSSIVIDDPLQIGRKEISIISTPTHNSVRKKLVDMGQSMQNFFKAPTVANTNFLRSSTNLNHGHSQLPNSKSMLKMSSVETMDFNYSPNLKFSKTNSMMFNPDSSKDIQVPRESSDSIPSPNFRKLSSNTNMPTHSHQAAQPVQHKRSPSMISDQDTENFKSSRKSQAPTNPRQSSSFQSLPEQIANLSNLTVDSTKFRKVVLTIINCYKSITRINFRTNVFNCEPIDLLQEIFTKPLPNLFTIDLRKNKFGVSLGDCKEDLGRLLALNVKVIV